MYTAEDARREVQEAVDKGYGYNYIRIFLNGLVRSRKISIADNLDITGELLDGKFGSLEKVFGTIA